VLTADYGCSCRLERGEKTARSESRYDIEQLSSRELVDRWRDLARKIPATDADIYEEISRRNVTRVNNLLLVFTAVVTVATIAALVIAIAKP
jgi:hypothetical protein